MKKKLLIAGLVLWLGMSSTAFAAVALVQGKNGPLSSGTQTVTFTSPVTANDRLIVCGIRDGGTAAPTISDTFGSTFALDVSKIPPISNDHFVGIYSAKAASSGSDTITWTVTGTPNVRGWIYEVSGLDPTNPVGAKSTGTGTGTALSAGSITPDTADGFATTCSTTDGGASETYTVGSGWTIDNTGSSIGVGQHRIVTSTASITGNMTMSASTEWAMILQNYHSTIAATNPFQLWKLSAF